MDLRYTWARHLKNKKLDYKRIQEILRLYYLSGEIESLSEVQEHILENYWTSLGVLHLQSITRESPHSNWCTKLDSLDLDNLYHTSYFNNASVRNKETVFHLNLWHTPLDIHLHHWKCHLTHYCSLDVSLDKTWRLEYMRRHGPKIYHEQGTWKIRNSTIKGSKRFWDYII